MIPFLIFELNKKTSLHSSTENQIDGEALVSLTERASEILIPVMGHRMKFLKLMKTVQSEESTCTTTVRPLKEDSTSEVEVEERSASTSKDPQTLQQTRYFFSLC